jgi:hypothetical protein
MRRLKLSSESVAATGATAYAVDYFLYFFKFIYLKKEVAQGGGERTLVLSISFISSFFTLLPLCHSGSPMLWISCFGLIALD